MKQRFFSISVYDISIVITGRNRTRELRNVRWILRNPFLNKRDHVLNALNARRK